MNKVLKKLRSNKGFTLVELLVVLAVLAIIAGIAVPKFAGVQDAAKLSADYSTGEMIARAADIYMAVQGIGSGSGTINVSSLTTGSTYLEYKDIKVQSKGWVVPKGNGDGSTGGNALMTISYTNYSVTSITVKGGAAASDIITIYPRP